MKKELTVLQLYQHGLSEGRNARSVQVPEEERVAVADLQLLTDKPVVYVANVDEGSVHTGNGYVDQLRTHVAAEGAQVVVICAAIEAQIAELESAEDREVFLRNTG